MDVRELIPSSVIARYVIPSLVIARNASNGCEAKPKQTRRFLTLLGTGSAISMTVSATYTLRMRLPR